MRKSICLMTLLGCFALFLSGCTSVPYSDRKRLPLLLTSESSELSMGEKAWVDINKEETEITGTAQAEAVKRVGQAVAQVAQRPDYGWEFKLFESKEPNAFCLPGGKIAVYSALFDYAANDAELAAVMGHEVGHALARHGGERMQYAMGLQLGLVILAHSEVEPEWLAAYGLGAQYGVLLPFSREHEYESDQIGLTLMAKAGYDPEAALSFWQKFGKLGSEFDWGSTHPAGSKRIEAIRQLLPQARAIYLSSPNQKGLGKVYEAE